MSDEPLSQNPAALDDATDRAIREMTQVQMSEDAVARVMARVRTARGPAVSDTALGVAATGGADDATTRGWFGALVEPRVSWGALAAAAALAAIIATGATILVLRERTAAPALVAVATPQASTTSPGSGPTRAGSTHAGAPSAASANVGSGSTALASAARAQGDIPLRVSLGGAASDAPTAGHAASDAAAAPARVARVERPKRSGIGKATAGLDPTVSAAMVAMPDEEPARGQEAPRAVPQDVRLDVTIRDQSGSGKPVSKTVSMVVADRESGSIRSQTRMPFKRAVGAMNPNAPPAVEAWDTEELPLNVEASPIILPDGHVRVKLGLSYRTASTPVGTQGGPLATASVTKNVVAVLTDGKPLVVSESADAATDRKVTVEIKATIQK